MLVISIFFIIGCNTNEDYSSSNDDISSNDEISLTEDDDSSDDDGAIEVIAIEMPEDEEEYAFDILQRINDAVADTDGLEIEFFTETLVIMPFEGIDYPLELESETTGNLLMLGIDDSFEAIGHVEQNHMGIQESYGVYFREDAIYVDLIESYGLGVRTPLEVFNIFSLINIHTDFLETAILEQSVETQTAGGIQLKFSLDDVSMLDVINGQLNKEPFNVENLGEYSYNFIITLDEDGAIASLDLEIEFDYVRDEDEIEVSMVASVGVFANADVAIEFPDNLEEFLPANSTIPVF